MFRVAQQGKPVFTHALEVDDDENPVALMTESGAVDFLPYNDVAMKIATGYQIKIDGELQKWARPGKSILILVKPKEKTWLAEVKYDPGTQRISI